MKNSFVHPTFVVVRENHLSVSNKTHCSCGCFFQIFLRPKKIFPRDLSQQFFGFFFVPEISLLCADSHGFLTSDVLRYYIVDVLIRIRRRKSRRKGPERERESLQGERGESYIVHHHHHHHARRRRAYICICGKKLGHSSKRRFDLTTRQENPSSSKNHDVLCFCARQRRL